MSFVNFQSTTMHLIQEAIERVISPLIEFNLMFGDLFWNLSLGQMFFFPITLDDYIHVTWTYVVKNQFGKDIKRIRSDNGIEYVNYEPSKLLSLNGIVCKLSCVNTSQQNKVAERKNCHLLEVVRVVIFHMSISKTYWGETVNCHISHQQVSHSCLK